MAPEDRDRSRGQQVRGFAIGAVVWVVLAGLFAMVVVALRRKRSQER